MQNLVVTGCRSSYRRETKSQDGGSETSQAEGFPRVLSSLTTSAYRRVGNGRRRWIAKVVLKHGRTHIFTVST